MDNNEFDQHQESLESDNEILRKSLVKVSFAAGGIHSALDTELQKLRQVIRADSDGDKIHNQVESIAQALMLVDDEMQQQKSSMSSEELLSKLGEQLSDDLPSLSSKISKILSNKKHQTFISTLTKLSQTLPVKNKPKLGFFSTLFSKSSSIVEENQTDLLKRISLTMKGMIKQLSFLNNSPKSLTQIETEIETLNDIEEVPQILQSVCTQVFDITTSEQLKFEQFLKNLNVQLDVVQKIISTNSQHQVSNTSAGNLLNQQVRKHMVELQAKSKSSSNIADLQHFVEDRVDKMLSNLDTYKSSLDSFVTQNTKQMELLSSELDNSRSNINELQEQLQEQQHLAETDPLTNLPNRHAYQRRIAEEYNRWRRYRQPLSIAIADVDLFKSVNDNHGHSQGDEVLKTIAQIFSQELRETDFVARYGGEEFIFIMPETNLTQATKAINKLRLQIAGNKFTVEGKSLPITVSMGVAEFEDNDTIDDLVNRSDKALYRAKEKGRNQVCCELKEKH